jgi:hypothetical protein
LCPWSHTIYFLAKIFANYVYLGWLFPFLRSRSYMNFMIVEFVDSIIFNKFNTATFVKICPLNQRCESKSLFMNSCRKHIWYFWNPFW